MNGQTSYRNGQTSFYEWTDVSPISSTARRSEGRFIPVQMRLNKHAEGWGGWGGRGGVCSVVAPQFTAQLRRRQRCNKYSASVPAVGGGRGWKGGRGGPPARTPPRLQELRRRDGRGGRSGVVFSNVPEVSAVPFFVHPNQHPTVRCRERY